MRDFGVPEPLSDIAGTLLPLAELAVAVALILRPSAQWAGVAGLVLLLSFIGGIANALRQGVAPDCHCFGQIHSRPAGRETLLRNGILVALAVIVVGWGTGPAINAWVNARSAAELVAVGLGLLAALFATMWVQLRAELSRVRVDLERAERIAVNVPPGLPVGAMAPDFELASLDGGPLSLASLLDAGRPLLMVFGSPSCGSCAEVFPNIQRWQRTLQDRLTIVIASVGTPEQNEPLRSRYGLTNVVLQKDVELVEAYRIRGTPSAVLVSPEGKIASVPAESVFAIEPLVRLVLRGGDVVAVPQGSVA